MSKFGINEGIEIATKLSLAKYKIKFSNTIVLTLHNGKTVSLYESDKYAIQELLNAWPKYESSIEMLLNYWIHHQNESLISILKSYPKHTKHMYIPSRTVCSLYFAEKPQNMQREESGRTWINYNDQINRYNAVFDIANGNGIWTAPIDMLPRMINSNSLNNYGCSIMILKTFILESYFLTPKNEIIGSKYKHIFHGPLDSESTWNSLNRFVDKELLHNVDTENVFNSDHNRIVDAINNSDLYS